MIKQNRLLFGLFGIVLLIGLAACSEEDMRVFGDDFEIPELTDANTIQFTVNITNEWKLLQVLGTGGRMAVEWGDGRLQKIANADIKPIVYKYGNNKTYHVRVWAEELDFINVGGEMPAVSNLRLGYLPKMKDVHFNSFIATPELNLSASCPNLESMNIGNWADLKSIDISQCLKLHTVSVYSNPILTSLNLRGLSELRTLMCYGNDMLSSLSFKGLANLNEVQCSGNPRLSSIEVDSEMSIRRLHVSNCAFQALDFLSRCPLISELDCGFNQLKTLDVSALLSLSYFNCSENKSLTYLLTPVRSNLHYLNCSSCQLDKDVLNALFQTLPVASISYPGRPSDSNIYYFDNPGADGCDRNILFSKGWNILSRSELR